MLCPESNVTQSIQYRIEDTLTKRLYPKPKMALQEMPFPPSYSTLKIHSWKKAH